VTTPVEYAPGLVSKLRTPDESSRPDTGDVPARYSQQTGGGAILIAEDERIVRSALARVLMGAGYRVVEVADGQAALERGSKPDIDLVLLDVVMPRLSGLEACRLLKAATSDRFLPIVLVTVRSDATSRVEGLRIGADDYVCKPFEPEELLARVEALLRIKRLHDHVRGARAKLEEMSVHDPLTGVHNYRYLHTRLSEEFRRAERYQEPMACLVVDIDGLAAHNRRGRSRGDDVLKRVANVLQTAVRDIDVVARLGEDEFVLILPNTHFVGSVKVAERVWQEVARGMAGTDEPPSPRVTVSVGAAMYPSRDVRTKEAVLRGAEAALREAKQAGGNRVCVFQQRGYVYTAASGDAAFAGPRQEGSASEKSSTDETR
jgi:two-component system cell cycle response regulator